MSTYTIRGTITTNANSGESKPVPYQKLIPCHIDIKGVGKASEMSSMVDVKNQDGIQEIEYMDLRSDVNGNYELKLEFDATSKKSADANIVLFAVDDSDRIIGRSKVVRAEEYLEQGALRNINIAIQSDREGRTEFEIAQDIIQKYLDKYNLKPEELYQSGERLQFLRDKIDLPENSLQLFTQIYQLGQKDEFFQSHRELLYGIGKQGIDISLDSIFQASNKELEIALISSKDQEIISKTVKTKKKISQSVCSEDELNFLEELEEKSTEYILREKKDKEGNSFQELLSESLCNSEQQYSFLRTYRNYEGSPENFWTEELPNQPEFEGEQEAISSLQLTSQLMSITGNYSPLVKEFLSKDELNSAEDLLRWTDNDWQDLLKKTGVPEPVSGDDEGKRIENFKNQMKASLNALYPTRKIQVMLEEEQLPIKKEIAGELQDFLGSDKYDFDIAKSNIQDYKEALYQQIDGELPKDKKEKKFKDIRNELASIQRTFQVSPSPDTLKVLKEEGLDSAFDISSIPQNRFMSMYSTRLGGEEVAKAVHEKASYIKTKNEHLLTGLHEITQRATPKLILDNEQLELLKEDAEKEIPNYENLFGTPTFCECKHCRSVYSPAAYLVDLLRFLEKSGQNGNSDDNGKTALEVLKERRPDLLHLDLTCENTNTLVPYTDLVNEVLEYYTAHNEITPEATHNTGDVSSQELQAEPQNVQKEAYEVLAKQDYPFSLPYNRPLDVMRTYLEELDSSRYKLIRAFQKENDESENWTGLFTVPYNWSVNEIRANLRDFDISRYEIIRVWQKENTDRLLDSEALGLSAHEYDLIVDESRDENEVEKLYGVENINELIEVETFLDQTGIEYEDLIDLLKTKYINPDQDVLYFLQMLVESSEEELSDINGLPTEDLYTKLKRLANDEEYDDEGIIEKLQGKSTKGKDEFKNWWSNHFKALNNVTTLYQPDSRCDLESTYLKNIGSIYQGEQPADTQLFDRLHWFIRLWRNLDWTIHELDVMLHSLEDGTINEKVLHRIAKSKEINEELELPVEQLSTLWGNIAIHREESLFQKLVLERSSKLNYINPVFPGIPVKIEGAGIREVFKLSGNEFDRIKNNLTGKKDGQYVLIQDHEDSIDTEQKAVYLAALSSIYRYKVLAKGLDISIQNLSSLINLFDAKPFSYLNISSNNGDFVEIDPEATLAFIKLIKDIQDSSFDFEQLMYLLDPNADSSEVKPPKNSVLNKLRSLYNKLHSIENKHPKEPGKEFSVKDLEKKLLHTFQPEAVEKIIKIIDGKVDFDDPERFIRTNLTWLVGAQFEREEDELNIEDKEKLVGELFANYQSNDDSENGKDNDSPLDKFKNLPKSIYQEYRPLLIQSTQREYINKHLSEFTGIKTTLVSTLLEGYWSWYGEDETKVLFNQFAYSFEKNGFSATYYRIKNPNSDSEDISEESHEIEENIGDIETDLGIDYSEEDLKVTWQAYIAAKKTGDYKLIVDTKRASDSFKIFLDDKLVLKKESSFPPAEDSLEKSIEINNTQLHKIKLEYRKNHPYGDIQIRWKRSDGAAEELSGSEFLPAENLDHLVENMYKLHRAGTLIDGFSLNKEELAFFVDYPDFNFEKFSSDQWKWLNSYTNLRGKIDSLDGNLTDFLEPIISDDGVVNSNLTEEFVTTILEATGWPESVLKKLNNHFDFGVAQPDIEEDPSKFNQAINQIQILEEAVGQAGKLENDVTLIEKILENDLVVAGPNYDKLYVQAETIKNVVEKKYDHEEWLNIAERLNDKIRTHSQQALIDHLVNDPDLREEGVYDADGLFEYFLIDVQMDICMDTSRIKQAISSVQLFIARCLMNLEDELSPDVIDKERWTWMKNYRVWEANRKIFLYPENWLNPEWRQKKTPFFEELESELTQSDITDESVKSAFRKYLNRLNEVSNLEVMGMYKEEENDRIHVVGRTNTAPYTYYYRLRDQYGQWNAWEEIPVEIPNNGEGEDSGAHVLPVVWKERLFLFWPEFTEKKEKAENSSKSPEDMADESIKTQEPNPYWQVKLAWSEYEDGSWSGKQIGNNYIELGKFDAPKEVVKNYSISSNIDSGNRLNIIFISQNYKKEVLPIFENLLRVDYGVFTLIDISSSIRAKTLSINPKKIRHFYPNNYAGNPHFLREKKIDNGKVELKIEDKNILSASDSFYYLYSNDLTRDHGSNNNLTQPLIFFDEKRSYFVEPHKRKYTEVVPVSELVQPVVYIGSQNSTLLSYEIENSQSPDLINRTPIGNGIGGSFTGSVAIDEDWFPGRYTTRRRTINQLKFHTFYHPFTDEFKIRLNRNGLEGLLSSDVDIEGDGGDTFESKSLYDPEFGEEGFGPVYKLTEQDEETLYKENVAFDDSAAYSRYNWELFYHAPLYIATQLNKNGRFEEAMKWFHFIFDPTTNETSDDGKNENSRYWNVKYFKDIESKNNIRDWMRQLTSEDSEQQNDTIKEWRNKPFRPHIVAQDRPVSYMKHVVFKYVENLIDWGDYLFKKDTMESINRATQLYVRAGHILGDRPQNIPKRGTIDKQSYSTLKDRLDEFGNALVELENIFPYTSDVSISENGNTNGLLGIGETLYFCIPNNQDMIKYWDLVEDRLFKIRNCMNIEGVERTLALFEPPIDPGMLAQAAAQGLSPSQVMQEMNSPPPVYRFNYVLQKAKEFCNEVVSYGSTLLSTLEKRDSEELSQLRASHETTTLEQMKGIKERELLEAKSNRENLLKSRESAVYRLKHYASLLGKEEEIEVPSTPEIDPDLDADSQLPSDTNMKELETEANDEIVESEDSSVKLIPREKMEFESMTEARENRLRATIAQISASYAASIPTFSTKFQPLGAGGSISFGGSNISSRIQMFARHFQHKATNASTEGQKSAKIASYIRREQNWVLQANMAAKEIARLDKQIVAAQIREQMAKKSLENHKEKIKRAEEVENFLIDKFTNKELYNWMEEHLSSLHKEAYDMAFALAKKAEKAYQYELGDKDSNFIQYGYYDNARKGLTAGEQLKTALRELEKSHLENNEREFELTKHISLARLNPMKLQQLKETGVCEITIPEELFDMDYPGHYFRRIKSVSLSIPGVTGPYTTISCTLRLLNNHIRIETTGENYGPEEQNGEENTNRFFRMDEDPRFRSSNVPVKSIATSEGQNDSGMFELNFRDERYLPFEGAGAISRWELELTKDKNLRQFDYSTISDVILHLNYTAREGGKTLKENAKTNLKDELKKENGSGNMPLTKMFDLKSEFSTEWHKFVNDDEKTSLELKLSNKHFPYLAQQGEITIQRTDLLIKGRAGVSFKTKQSPPEGYEDSEEYPLIEMSTEESLGKDIVVGTKKEKDEALQVPVPYPLKIEKANSEGTIEEKDIKEAYLIIHYNISV